LADDLLVYKQFLLRFECRVQPCVAFVVVHHHTKAPTYPPWARPPKAIDGPRGKSQRASDWYGLPLCARHHDQLHDPAKKGHFFGWTGEQIIAWQDEQVEAMHALFEEEIARNPSSPLAQLRDLPWEPPADKARERRERKKKRGKRRGRMSEALEELQELSETVTADAVALVSPSGAVGIANRERGEIVQWLRARAGRRRVAPEVFQELSDTADELESMTRPLSMRTT